MPSNGKEETQLRQYKKRTLTESGYFSGSGAMFEIPNQFVIIYGKAEAMTAPVPMKKLCIAKP
ncbi:MAG: hypothetical protein MZV64_06250 [Ignavibacteriales bacterium]|nr:hypothetical protein [Ignavibacteriales bacterium]